MLLTLFPNHGLKFFNHIKTIPEEGVLLVDKSLQKSTELTGYLFSICWHSLVMDE